MPLKKILLESKAQTPNQFDNTINFNSQLLSTFWYSLYRWNYNLNHYPQFPLSLACPCAWQFDYKWFTSLFNHPVTVPCRVMRKHNVFAINLSFQTLYRFIWIYMHIQSNQSTSLVVDGKRPCFPSMSGKKPLHVSFALDWPWTWFTQNLSWITLKEFAFSCLVQYNC